MVYRLCSSLNKCHFCEIFVNLNLLKDEILTGIKNIQNFEKSLK